MINLGLFIDEQGNLYKIENEGALKRSDSINVYSERGEKFELNKQVAERLKLTGDQANDLISKISHNYLTDMYLRIYPEAAFARAPEAAFARAPEAAFARAPEAAFARAPEAAFARAPEAAFARAPEAAFARAPEAKLDVRQK